MCTIGRTAGGTACKAHHRTDRTQYPLRYGQERKDYGTEGCRSSFLNTTFQPKPLPSLVVEDSDGKRHNLITRDNYGFLRDSFFRYAYLMEKEAVHTPGRTFGEGIARLLFKLWKAHHWGKLTLYYFPMKFVEALGSELRRISITFIHELMKANGIQTVLDEDDTEYVLTWISEEVPEETPEERKKRLRLLRSYENGRIKRLLQRVECKCYYKNLPKALDRYKARNDYERSLVSAMKEGLQFLSPERGIMEYSYDPFYEKEPEFHPMYLYQQIRVIYDSYDMVTDYLVDCYNSHTFDRALAFQLVSLLFWCDMT